MTATIREEIAGDEPFVNEVIQAAFVEVDHSAQTEHLLVDRLRRSEAFVPELSLVAEQSDQIVGHILLTKITLAQIPQQTDFLALAPVSVLPKWQQKGIGSLLINAAHKRAIELGYRAIFLIGHADYYPRFGYQPAHLFQINFPFDAPRENCFAYELVDESLKYFSGTLKYPEPWQIS